MWNKGKSHFWDEGSLAIKNLDIEIDICGPGDNSQTFCFLVPYPCIKDNLKKKKNLAYRIVVRISEFTNLKCSEQCLAHSKCYRSV